MHQHDQRSRLVIFHDQGLDHQMLVDPQFARRHFGAAMLLVGIRMLGESHRAALQEGGRGGLGHALFFRQLRCSCQPRG